MNKFITVHSDNGKNRSMVNIDFIVSVVEYEGKNYLTVKGIENPALIDENISQVQQLLNGAGVTTQAPKPQSPIPSGVFLQPTADVASTVGATPPASVFDESIVGLC